MVVTSRLRRCLKVYQYDFAEAKILFAILKKEGSDWRDRTYASHWIQRLSRYTAEQLSMLNCGTQAIAYLLEKEGRIADARRALEILPQSLPGHSIEAVSEISSRFGYRFTPLRLSVSELKLIPLPAIMHIKNKDKKNSGHYWILNSIDNNEDTLELFDPQAGLRFEQTADQFSKEWVATPRIFRQGKAAWCQIDRR
jgi:ABC-type bacteriocin/lantibiotic exporter with double-glycine peptidase domain